VTYIIDGKKLAEEHRKALEAKLNNFKRKPVLVSILVGEDPASVLYTNIKQKKALDLGIDFLVAKFPAEANFEIVAAEIKRLNEDTEVDGIMIQLPSIPGLVGLIKPEKDVDGLLDDSPYMAATVRAIMSIIHNERIDLSEKKVVVLGSRGEVGSRLMKVLEAQVKKIVGVDKETKDLKTVTMGADLIVSSTGHYHILKGDMVKNGVVVIDVGSEKMPDGQVCGDVEFESVAPKASIITPVPGGVGPMTVISLMENVAEAVDR